MHPHPPGSATIVVVLTSVDAIVRDAFGVVGVNVVVLNGGQLAPDTRPPGLLPPAYIRR